MKTPGQGSLPSADLLWVCPLDSSFYSLLREWNFGMCFIIFFNLLPLFFTHTHSNSEELPLLKPFSSLLLLLQSHPFCSPWEATVLSESSPAEVEREAKSYSGLIIMVLPQDLCSGCCVSLDTFLRYMPSSLPHLKSSLTCYILTKAHSIFLNTSHLPNPIYPTFRFFYLSTL